MNELFHVIKREYLTRVCTKTFIITTFLTPILLSSIFLLPAYFATKQEDYKQMKIGLVDFSGLFKDAFNESELIVELLPNNAVEDIKSLVLTGDWEGIVYVEKSDSAETNIQYYSGKQPSVFLTNQIRTVVQRVIVNARLSVYGIDNVDAMVRDARASVSIENVRVSAEKTQTVSSRYQQPLCMVLGVTIYMFVLLFSSQVMRGVQEEKSSRIVEIIITSISPVKFMAGKIIGIALLGLTQIVCWIILMYGFSLFLSNFAEISGNTNNFLNERISQDDINKILSNINQIDFNAIIPAFIFFFIGGYLLYSSVFAAIAATANHSDDIQRVTMIVTLPLILSVMILTNTVNSPDSTISYWFSIIPFTSPVVMMGRIVYGAPVQDILLSMFILTLTVAFVIWLSGKIYKMAILYTGKKISGKEILSWIRNINN
jgi:ABC-2 type transport system permease protein